MTNLFVATLTRAKLVLQSLLKFMACRLQCSLENKMNKDNWGTIVFALENYIQELQDNDEFVTEHIWKTLWLAADEWSK
jgi:hypothetical protein